MPDLGARRPSDFMAALHEFCPAGEEQCCQPAENSAKYLKTGRRKNCLQRKIGGHTAAIFGEKRPKTDVRNVIVWKAGFWKVFLLLSVSFSQQICKNVYTVNI
jgi:hypothetical protein